jgi:hypothetical protein
MAGRGACGNCSSRMPDSAAASGTLQHTSSVCLTACSQHVTSAGGPCRAIKLGTREMHRVPGSSRLDVTTTRPSLAAKANLQWSTGDLSEMRFSTLCIKL